MFKRHLDNVFNNMLQLLVSSEVVRQLDAMVFVGPFPLNFSVLLCPTGSLLSLGHLHQIWLPESQLLPGRGCFPEKNPKPLEWKGSFRDLKAKCRALQVCFPKQHSRQSWMKPLQLFLGFLLIC